MPGRYYTPPIPNGWFQVAYSRRARAGPGRSARTTSAATSCCFAARTAWRACSTRSARTSARTLGYGGKVEGDCIRCPFHAWKFDGDGELRRDPVREEDPAARRSSRLGTCARSTG